MSTILKALKQAEKDCPDQENENRPSFNVRTVLIPQMQQKSSRFSSLGRAVAPLAVVSGVAIFFYALFFMNKNNQPHPSFRGEQSQVFLTPEPVNQAPDSSSLSKKVTETSLGPLDTDSLKKVKKKSSNPPIKQKKISEDPAPLTGEAPTSGQLQMKDSAKGEKEVVNAKPPKQVILPLENNSLKVQAISWDQKDANGIAVIENSVLREGDFIQGYRLVRIEKDSVILHYSGSDYRLGFRYR